MKIPKSIFVKASAAFLRRDFRLAESLYRRALSYSPKDFYTRSSLAVVLNELGKIEEFYQLAQELYKERPTDPGILNRVGIAHYRKGEFNEAYAKLKQAIPLDPGRFETFLNLSSVAGEVGDMRGALEYGLEAVRLDPKNPAAHTNLGSAFMSSGRPKEAQHCFETVLILDPLSNFARTNLAVLKTKDGNHAEAILAYEACLNDLELSTTEEQKIRFFLGLSYLVLGNLTEGWKNYRFGFIEESVNGRNPCRKFGCEEWNGESLAGKTILVWREQGLGDEIMFFSALDDLRIRAEKEGGKVIVESDWRLCKLLGRSFPTFKVRPQAYFDKPNLQSPFMDFDLHIPCGNLFAYFRASKSDFDRSKPYLTVDERARQLFDTRLGDRLGKLRVGICWRSGALSAIRNVNYTALVDWVDLLLLKNIQLVNLQYGDTEKERGKVIDELGAFINHWPDLDLKDDLENTAALCSNLDLVISVGTAAAQLACAVGTPTLILSAGLGWTAFGTSTYPVYPNARFIIPSRPNASVSTLLPHIARVIAELGNEPNLQGDLLRYISERVSASTQD